MTNDQTPLREAFLFPKKAPARLRAPGHF